MKDPIAMFSADWLAQTFDMDVVVMMRHPAAFADSLKRRGWQFPFSQLLDQPLLMGTLLQALEPRIAHFVRGEHDIIDQAALVWRVIYTVACEYRRRNPNWVFIRHEDLARDPIGGFEDLFRRLDLEFAGRARHVVDKYSSARNTGLPSGRVRDLKRNSASVVHAWKRNLLSEEVQRIRNEVEDVSCEYYSDADW